MALSWRGRRFIQGNAETFGENRQFVAEEMMEFPISKHVYIFDIASDRNISSANKELNDLRAQDWLDLESAQLQVRNTHAGRSEGAVLGRHSSLP